MKSPEGAARTPANVPKLQYESGVVGFFRGHLGYTFASSALMDAITKDFVKAIERFCDTEGVDLFTFQKGPAQGRHRPPVPGRFQRR